MMSSELDLSDIYFGKKNKDMLISIRCCKKIKKLWLNYSLNYKNSEIALAKLLERTIKPKTTYV